ncbi:hypothetical protein AB0K80_21680 [Streptomyces sp. NPDC052682]|uniref:hypothetical protein n=1 Tax=Streptomyces sp. NPDC052682 TaxID=3154954 RepID=UPI0034266919
MPACAAVSTTAALLAHGVPPLRPRTLGTVAAVPWVLLVPVWSALDWLGEAAVVAHRERRNGRLLWRGHVTSRPWELSWSPAGCGTTAGQP